MKEEEMFPLPFVLENDERRYSKSTSKVCAVIRRWSCGGDNPPHSRWSHIFFWNHQILIDNNNFTTLHPSTNQTELSFCC